jgi:hypothetical protein
MGLKKGLTLSLIGSAGWLLLGFWDKLPGFSNSHDDRQGS